MDASRNITYHESLTLAPIPFRHKMTTESTTHNDQVLTRNGCNLIRVIAACTSTEISYGVELRSPSILKPLLGKKNTWLNLSMSIVRGTRSLLTKILESNRASDLEEGIRQENHKSDWENPQELVKMVSKDIKFRHQLPVPVDAIRKFKYSCTQPCDITFQNLVSSTILEIEIRHLSQQ